MDFSIRCIFGQFCGATQTRYWKTGFCPFKENQNKVLPAKNGILNFHFYPFPNLEFWLILKKISCFIISIDVWPLPLMVYSDLLMFDNVIRIPCIKILLYIHLILGRYYTDIM